jgi:two-component system cell cycle response regulator DivK
LIVDDDERNRNLARDVLRAADLRTIEAASGGEGIALAIERLPDVVLLDLRLPDMDGTDVARNLRKGAETAAIPVVALTAIAADEGGEWLSAAGFAGYLSKPINIREFPTQVRRYCAMPAPEPAT